MAKILPVTLPILAATFILTFSSKSSHAEVADASPQGHSRPTFKNETYSLCVPGFGEDFLKKAAKTTGAPMKCHYGKLISRKEENDLNKNPPNGSSLMASRDGITKGNIEKYLKDLSKDHGPGVVCAEGSPEEVEKEFWSCFGKEHRAEGERVLKLAMENKIITLAKCESTEKQCDAEKIPAALDSGQKLMCCTVHNNPFTVR